MRELGFPDQAAAKFLEDAVNGGDTLQLQPQDLLGDMGLSKLQVMTPPPPALPLLPPLFVPSPDEAGATRLLWARICRPAARTPLIWAYSPGALTIRCLDH